MRYPAVTVPIQNVAILTDAREKRGKAIIWNGKPDAMKISAEEVITMSAMIQEALIQANIFALNNLPAAATW